MVREVQGDSVIGTWQALPNGDAPRVARRLSGPLTCDTVRLSTQGQVQYSVNGNASQGLAPVVYAFVLRDAGLQGTIRIKLDGASPGAPRTFSAVREPVP
jgi:hypothetical protein